MDLIASLRENIIADAFDQGRIRDGSLAERLVRERLNAADEIERLRLEIETLRRYGNKDCTAMADDALEQKRATGKGPWED